MADTIDITPGVGKTVATDDCGAAGHTQVVKLAISTDGAATAIPADASNGLDVDVTRVGGNVSVIGPAAHDAAAATAPVVVAGVASAAAPSSVSADGDVVNAWRLRNGAEAVVVTAAGALIPGDAANGLDVDVTRLPAPYGAAGASSVAKAEDAVSADGDVGIPAMAVRKATPANTSGTDGDYEMLQMSAGRLWASATIDAALPAGTNNIGDVDVLTVPTDPFGANADAASATGSLSAKMRFIAATGIPITALPASTNTIEVVGDVAHDAPAAGNPVLMAAYAKAAAPSNVSADADAVRLWALLNGALVTNLSAAGALIPGDATLGLAVEPRGNLAHDAVDSGNPVKVGARAVATLATATMVAAADRTDNVSDLDGAQLTRSGFPLGDLISERVTNTDGASTAFSNFAAVASTRSYITAIVVYNSSATAGTVDFRDGTGGSVLWTMPIPAGGGAVISNGGSPLFRTSASTALAFDVSGALTTVTISVSGFKSKV